ncbi:hypothetical protein [Fusobacterium varium]|uniref:hypothetical protein n=1 Tax=Fusobacterium varium TaxID=856 RepID=UPI0030CECAF6
MKDKKEIIEEFRIELEKDLIKFMNSSDKEMINKKFKYAKDDFDLMLIDNQYKKILEDFLFELNCKYNGTFENLGNRIVGQINRLDYLRNVEFDIDYNRIPKVKINKFIGFGIPFETEYIVE